MKSPREIILDQHRNAETKLAEIRAEDLAAMARSAQTVQASSVLRVESSGLHFLLPLRSLRGRGEGWGEVWVRFIGLRGNRITFGTMAQNFWNESILPWRRVWVGLAAVWLGVFALNLAAQTTMPHITLAKAPRADSRVVLAEWRERRQMLAQLLGPAIPAAEAAHKIPGPRGSLRIELMVV